MRMMIDNAVGRGFEVLGIGMLVVVGMLMLLMAILYLVIPVFRKIDSASKNRKKSKEPAPVQTPAAPVETSSDDSEEEIVAAIIAAIASGEGKSPSSFRVVSFKRI